MWSGGTAPPVNPVLPQGVVDFSRVQPMVDVNLLRARPEPRTKSPRMIDVDDQVPIHEQRAEHAPISYAQHFPYLTLVYLLAREMIIYNVQLNDFFLLQHRNNRQEMIGGHDVLTDEKDFFFLAPLAGKFCPSILCSNDKPHWLYHDRQQGMHNCRQEGKLERPRLMIHGLWPLWTGPIACVPSGKMLLWRMTNWTRMQSKWDRRPITRV